MSGELHIQMRKILDEYLDDIEDGVDEIAEELGDEGVEMLRAASPKRRPKYFKGWRKRVDTSPSGNKEVTIHNATDPSLTHLLEKGHPIVRAGKVVGRSPAIPHILPVEQELIRKFIERVRPK